MNVNVVCDKCANGFIVPLSLLPVGAYVCQSCQKETAKPSNPKDMVGSTKLPLNLVPAVTVAYAALGHGEGMLKYGLVNWRECGVRMSIYLDALERHIKKVTEGEWIDPKSGVPHFANALACISIIIDAYHAGKLIDDRPLSNPGAIRFIESEGVEIWKGLMAQHADKHPHHYTIEQGHPQRDGREDR